MTQRWTTRVKRLINPLYVERMTTRDIDEESRAITSVPWVNGGNGYSYSANALHLIPYFSCVRVLAEQISVLSLESFREQGKINVRTKSPRFVKDPAAYVDKVTWTRQMVISLATRGNAVGIITGYDNLGFPTGIEWIPFNEIYVDETRPTLPVYWWGNRQDGHHEIPLDRVVHISWFTPPGRVVGLSPVSAFAASIGVGLSATTYGATWFDNGGLPPSTFKNTSKTITPDQAEEITDRLMSSIRKGRPLTYGADWDFSAVQINPEESQFIETMQLNATQMASIFGIPPEMVGGTSGGSLTYDTPVLNGIALGRNVLNPWLTMIESRLSDFVPDDQFLRYNTDAFERADVKTRYEAYALAITNGFLTVDEVRQKENLPPAPKPDPASVAPVLVPFKPGSNGSTPNGNGNGDSGDGRKFYPLKVTS